MKKISYIRLLVLLFLLFGFVPTVNYSAGSFSVRINHANNVHGFQGTQGQIVEYTISINYWVDLDYGDELCSYENTETIRGTRCIDSWMECTASDITFTSFSYTGNSISLDEIYQP